MQVGFVASDDGFCALLNRHDARVGRTQHFGHVAIVVEVSRHVIGRILHLTAFAVVGAVGLVGIDLLHFAAVIFVFGERDD